jgi:thermitase
MSDTTSSVAQYSGRARRSLALITVASICLASVIAVPQTAASQPLPVACDEPGSIRSAPTDSTPEPYRDTDTGVPLSPGSEIQWQGPCGTTGRFPTAPNSTDYDHFYFELTEVSDLQVRIEWPNPTDLFVLTLYRGRVEKTEEFRPSCEGAEPPCSLAGEGRLARVFQEVALSDLQPGTYTVRATYSVVADSYYEGTVSASFPAPDPPEIPPPDDTPAERGLYPLTPTDDFFDSQWGLTNIKAPQAWQHARATGFGITIATVDTGVDLGHPDFSCPGKLLVLEGATIGKEGPPLDGDGHGTHVSGIAAACTHNDKGVAGVAPDATIMPVNANDAFVESDILPGGADGAMAAGIRFATENGAHVINLSIGPLAPESYFPEVHPETEAALEEARAAGVVIAAAAGNFSSPVCEYPSLSRFVICVGALDRDDQKPFYSDLPNNVDRNSGETGPGVMAPGGAGRACTQVTGDVVRNGVVSTYLTDVEDEDCDFPPGYRELSGTSMASPHVAGVAALIYDRLGGERTPDNADLIVDTIIATADDFGPPGHDPVYGSGRVNALRAVQAIAVAAETDPDPDASPSPEPSPDPSAEPSPSSEPAGSPNSVVLSPAEAQSRPGADRTVTALVTDATGAPVPGAAVEWSSTGVGEISSREDTTDDAGRARAVLSSRQRGDQVVAVSTQTCAEDGNCRAEAVKHWGPAFCDVFGTAGNDLLEGTTAGEVICGFGGADVILGGGGKDVLLGGRGSDRLFGGGGADLLKGGGGNDELRGGRGGDRVRGGSGKDLLLGGSGRDRLHGGRGADRLDGGPGQDVCRPGRGRDEMTRCE